MQDEIKDTDKEWFGLALLYFGLQILALIIAAVVFSSLLLASGFSIDEILQGSAKRRTNELSHTAIAYSGIAAVLSLIISITVGLRLATKRIKRFNDFTWGRSILVTLALLFFGAILSILIPYPMISTIFASVMIAWFMRKRI